MCIVMKLYKKKNISVILLAIFLASSCIPVKDMVLVRTTNQDGDAQDASLETSTYVYKIRSGDELLVRLKDPDVSGSVSPLNPIATGVGSTSSAIPYKVNDDGTIILPEIGAVEVAGLTLVEINTLIADRAKGYIRQPNTHVALKNYFVKLLGQVKMPGIYQVQSLQPNFFEALALANGLTDYANRKEVQIIRSTGNNTDVTYIDITEPEFLSSPFYHIYPGDVIVINPIKVKRFENDVVVPYVLSAFSTLAVVLNVILINRR